MKINDQRHHLLSELADQRNAHFNDNVNGDKPLAMPFDHIKETLGYHGKELDLITSELLSQKEIGRYDRNNLIGLYITDVGIASLSSNKYKNLNIEIKRNSNKYRMSVWSFIFSIIAIILSGFSFYFNFGWWVKVVLEEI